MNIYKIVDMATLEPCIKVLEYDRAQKLCAALNRINGAIRYYYRFVETI